MMQNRAATMTKTRTPSAKPNVFHSLGYAALQSKSSSGRTACFADLGKGRNQAGIYKGEHKTAKRSERIGSHYKAISLILIFSWINSELYQKIAFKWIHGKKQLEFLAFNRVPFFLGKKHAFHLYT